MKKIIITTTLFISILAALFAGAILTVDYQRVLTDFLEKSNIAINISDIKLEKLEIKKFPFPILKISDIHKQEMGKIEDVEVKFYLLSILAFSPQVSDIRIKEAKLFLSSDSFGFSNHDKFIAEMIKKFGFNASVRIDRLSLVESDQDIFLELRDVALISDANNIGFTAISGVDTNISGSLSRNSEQQKIAFKLDVKSDTYSLAAVESYKDTMLEDGKVSLSVTNLPGYLVDSVPEVARFAGDLNSGSENVKIDFDIMPEKDGIKLTNIILVGKNIEGKGGAYLSHSSSAMSNFNFNFSKIDVHSWQSGEDSVVGEKKNRKILISSSGKGLSKLQIQGEIGIDSLRINEQLSLGKVVMKVGSESGNLKIEDFYGNINDKGSFRLFGIVEQNEFRKLFNGQFYLSGEDINDLVRFSSSNQDFVLKSKVPYKFSSGLKLSSVDLSLQNFSLKTSDSEISGNISTKFIGNLPRSNGDIKITYVNLDEPNYPAIGSVTKYFLSLTDQMKDENYLNKYIPIRKINLIGNYNFNIAKITSGGKDFDNINFNLACSAGAVKLADVSIINGNDYINGSVSLVAENIKPTLAIKITDGALQVPSLAPQAFLDLKDKILEKMDLEKLDLQLDINLSKLYANNFAFGRLLFLAKNNKNLFEVTNFNSDIFAGRMVSSGSILLSPFTLNFVYSLGGAQIEEIKKILPEGLLNTYGTLNARGMWTTSGNKVNELLYNLYTNSSITIKDMVIHNFSIDDLVQLVSASNYNNQNFADDLKNTLLTGDTEVKNLSSGFELSKGIISMPLMQFTTKYTKAKGAAKFNIYDFSIEADTNFSFQMASSTFGRGYSSYDLSSIDLKTTGTIFAPKKDADTSAVLDSINKRGKR